MVQDADGGRANQPSSSAYVGVVGDEGSTADFTALGDNVNITARLASEANAGEILISEAACLAVNWS